MGEAEVVGAYRAALGRYGEVVEIDLSSLDRLGVAVTSCSLAVDGRFAAHGNGYGRDLTAARVSGLGELAEGALAARMLADLRRGAVRATRRQLVGTDGPVHVADPRTLGLPAGTPYTDDLTLEWVALRRVRTGQPVWVPVEVAASDPADLDGVRPLLTPVTNGLGAGTDPTRPLAHGLGEILQRHTNGLRFRALDRRSPEIEPDGLPDSVRGLVERFARSGVRPVLKHAASELGVCSTYVMGTDPEPGARIMLSACGEAAHPDPGTSLTKALLEYANSRARKAFFFGDPALARRVCPPGYRERLGHAAGEPRAVAAMRAWAELDTPALRRLTAPVRTATVDYPALAAGPDSAALGRPDRLLDTLLEGLSGYDVLAASVEADGVTVAKTVVPGLEVEILSYGRIGEAGSRESLEADLDLVRIQPGPTGEHRARVCLTEEAEDRLGGPAWFSYAVADRLVGRLYPLYREPPRHSVQV